MKYSIVLPVRNGGQLVKQCVASVLAQDYGDFNLLILDNSSTDGTFKWALSINDPRVHVYSSTAALTIQESWGRIKSIPRNEFMTIIGHDDLLDTSYLQAMDALIGKYPDASLYQAHFRYIDEEGNLVRKCAPMAEKLSPTEVIHNFLNSKMDIMGTGFMARSADYDAIGGVPAYPSLLFADMELWIELSRRSFLAVAESECFSYRVHPAAMTPNSADLDVLEAFDQFVNYLEKLKKEDRQLAATIGRDSKQLLKQYCQGITHRVLRTPHKKRLTPSVAAIIGQFREYGSRLLDGEKYEPLDSKIVKLGMIIDENPFLHSLYLLFRKVYSKPL